LNVPMTRFRAPTPDEQEEQRLRLVPAGNVELTCTREVGHVYYSVPPEAVEQLRGTLCPRCRRGMVDVIRRP
jgi:uncharacterized protein CbrC (UPF0167 family)